MTHLVAETGPESPRTGGRRPWLRRADTDRVGEHTLVLDDSTNRRLTNCELLWQMVVRVDRSGRVLVRRYRRVGCGSIDSAIAYD